jgi:hypothetical protein
MTRWAGKDPETPGPGVVQGHLGQAATDPSAFEGRFGLGMEKDDPTRLEVIGDVAGQDAADVGLVALEGPFLDDLDGHRLVGLGLPVHGPEFRVG